ncbi:MAG: hypothetical protein IKF39_02065 [Oscillospiraceae bacterium]|nr:hypothetical protein [Oscillospiraceae bacterium]
MSKSKNTKPAAPKYDTERLLRSKALADYQQDFARAVLTEPEYTIEEAKAAIETALSKGV